MANIIDILIVSIVAYFIVLREIAIEREFPGLSPSFRSFFLWGCMTWFYAWYHIEEALVTWRADASIHFRLFLIVMRWDFYSLCRDQNASNHTVVNECLKFMTSLCDSLSLLSQMVWIIMQVYWTCGKCSFLCDAWMSTCSIICYYYYYFAALRS